MVDTVDGLKERKEWLLKQLKLTDAAIEKALKKAAAPTWSPQVLPGLPPPPPKAPRRPSENDERHADFQTMRTMRLEQLGVEFVEDETNEPAFIAVSMKKLRTACASDDVLIDLFNAYLDSPAPARYTPPYPLRALAAEKWWRPLLEALRARAPVPAPAPEPH